MSLEKRVDDLPSEKRFKLAITLSKLTLKIWDKYSSTNELTYTDSVVGMNHIVDKDILKNTIFEIEKMTNANTNKIAKLKEDFSDPIVSLQDDDWELPYEVLHAFYSVNNLLDAFIGNEKTVFGESTIYVSINQAIDALETSKIISIDEIKTIITSIENES